MHHPDLEGVAIETEMPFDATHETLDPGVGADGPAPAARSVGAGESRAEPLLIRAPDEPLERAPLRALNPLE
jgi:hypothetical protein